MSAPTTHEAESGRETRASRPVPPGVPWITSIQWRLPLLVFAIVSVVVSAFATLAYREVKASRMLAASLRLQSVAGEFASTSAAQSAERLEALRALADDPRVRSFVAGDQDRRGDVVEALEAHEALAGDPGALVLFDSAGQSLVQSGDLGAQAGLWVRYMSVDSVAFGPLVEEDGLFSEVYARIRSNTGATLGYLVQQRAITSSPAAVKTVSDLIGNEARLLVGNVDGSVWTDLHAVTPAPPAEVLEAAQAGVYHRDGGTAVLGWATGIPGTPWALAVEFPERSIMVPALNFLRYAMGTGAVLILAGALAGWWVIRGITGPLVGMTQAAEAIAGGDYSHRVAQSGRDDEIGRLSQAFNTMAQGVEDARDHLEYVAATLEQSNEELEQFAYVASHDLQEPLRMVSSYVQLLRQRYSGQLDADADDFIGFAVDGADRMKQLIDGLLQLSRVGRSDISLRPVDLDDVFQQTKADLTSAIEDTRADVTSGPLPTVLGDEIQLRQLLQNLVGNAIKFANGQPPVVRIRANRQGGVWIISVKDQGIGFDASNSDRIFQMFQRLHSRSEYGGTGIGLSICKRIVERHGGTIWVHSAPGEGAEFSFTLQTADAHRPEGRGLRAPQLVGSA